ncbi:MAG TPA: glycosyltransferase family 1 protein [Roseiflexaceae bacterium]|nr:glycosyltransferase family 1 protein [Roseiflexaceae bacterium]
MNIAIDISVLRIAQAGVLVYTRSLIDALAEEIAGTGHTLTLLDVLPLNPGLPMRPLRAMDAPGVRVVRCQGIRRGYLSMLPGMRRGPAHALAERVDRALDVPWGLASTAAMGLALRSALAGVDVFHASDQFLHAPPGAAIVVTIHDMTTRVHPEWHVHANAAMHDAKDRFALQRATRVIADSRATREDIVRHLGVPAERISVVYLGYDERFRPHTPDETRTALERHGLYHGGYILSLGTLEPRKNYERLIAAYARRSAACQVLRAEAGAGSSALSTQHSALPLVIAGGHGWHDEPILAAPERYGVAGQVRFLGRVDDADLPALVAGARLFVYPSLYEGFGLPVLEALAAGVPVVAANATSLPEVLGDAGLLCDPRDPEDIARRMAEVLADPALAARLREAGPRRAAQFSWRRCARETLAAYEAALTTKTAGRSPP